MDQIQKHIQASFTTFLPTIPLRQGIERTYEGNPAGPKSHQVKASTAWGQFSDARGRYLSVLLFTMPHTDLGFLTGKYIQLKSGDGRHQIAVAQLQAHGGGSPHVIVAFEKLPDLSNRDVKILPFGW